MKIEPRILHFAKTLQNIEVAGDVNNFYAARRTNLQRHNLQHYLQQMRLFEPDTLLVGEAPGHNGCARTGVPFSSERLLRQGVVDGQLFGAHNGYRVTQQTAHHEQTAAAMWQVLASSPRLPLLWNAFPFHPHKKDDPLTNRKPCATELKLGAGVLEEIIALFGITQLIAVGNAADAVLTKMGLEHAKVRHPSYGGRREFCEGLGELLA